MTEKSLTTITQKGVEAGRDVIGRDQFNINLPVPAKPTVVVEQLLEKLQTEISSNSLVLDRIETLRHYYTKKSHDGVEGLEAKLEKAGRKHETFQALEKKEQFSKLLEKWSLYASAQQIFVHLMARADVEYSMSVVPQLGTLKEHEINDMIVSRIVNPIVAECGTTVFEMNHGTAMGMLYWLAEQCFIRWHQ